MITEALAHHVVVDGGRAVGVRISRGSRLEQLRAEREVVLSAGTYDLLAYIRRTTQSIYHPTSTCAIGAVVDSRLRVLGLPGLRVVDASVMPSVPRGNTNAATIMIAEKAADMIRDDAA